MTEAVFCERCATMLTRAEAERGQCVLKPRPPDCLLPLPKLEVVD